MVAKLYSTVNKQPLVLFESDLLNTTFDNVANYVANNTQHVLINMLQGNKDLFVNYTSEEVTKEFKNIPYQQIKKINLSIKPILKDMLVMFPIQYKQIVVDWIKNQTMLNTKHKYMNNIIIN